MAEIIWAESSRNDLKSIFDYIAQDSEYYAELFIDRLTTRVSILNNNIAAGKIVPEFNDRAVREIKEGNYRIIYQIRSQIRIEILRVHHSAQLLKRL